MIIKEMDRVETDDPNLIAGKKAERDVAFYLKRAFGDRHDVLVFNDLRLEYDEDAAQMDHLVLTRYGLIIVESKSVTTKVKVNEHGEWMRLFNGSWKGMPSPVQQSQRQADFLGKFLRAHTEAVLGKILGLQKGFGNFRRDILVAISDSGIIERPKTLPLAEVVKADQVVDKISAIIAD